MSISQPGGEQRRPNVVTVGGKPADKKSSGKAGKTAPPSRGKGGGGPRKPVASMRVNQQREWGPIALFTAVGVLAVAIVGWAAWAAFKPGGAGYSWDARAAAISGIVHEADMPSGDHSWEPIEYDYTPSIGGPHSFVWQQCMGNIYDAPIPDEHAGHSMEHGALWVTYRSGLDQASIDKLAAKVNGKPYMMMSPVDDLESAISLQAWGYQLRVDNADDKRIDEFISALRTNAGPEKGASCTGGNTATGTTPLTEEQAAGSGMGG